MNDGFMLKEPIPRPSDRPNPVKDKVGEWCRHIQMPRGDGKPTFKGGVIVYEDWKCCPICGAKRPEKKSLELWEKLIEFAESHGYKQTGDISAIHAYWMNMAKTAEAHFHDEQNEG